VSKQTSETKRGHLLRGSLSLGWKRQSMNLTSEKCGRQSIPSYSGNGAVVYETETSVSREGIHGPDLGLDPARTVGAGRVGWRAGSGGALPRDRIIKDIIYTQCVAETSTPLRLSR